MTSTQASHHQALTPIQYRPFSVDHLLQAGSIRDVGQLSGPVRAALERRVASGDVTKEVTYPEGWPVYRVVHSKEGRRSKGRAA